MPNYKDGKLQYKSQSFILLTKKKKGTRREEERYMTTKMNKKYKSNNNNLKNIDIYNIAGDPVEESNFLVPNYYKLL